MSSQWADGLKPQDSNDPDRYKGVLGPTPQDEHFYEAPPELQKLVNDNIDYLLEDDKPPQDAREFEEVLDMLDHMAKPYYVGGVYAELAKKQLAAAHTKSIQSAEVVLLKKLRAKATKWSNELPDYKLVELRHIEVELKARQ